MLCKFSKGGLEYIALLELFDRLLVDFFRTDHAQCKPGHQVQALVPGHVGITAAQGGCQVPVDELQRQITLLCSGSRRLHLGSWFNSKLIGDAPLVGAECKISHHQPGLAFTDDLVQIKISPVAFTGQGVVTGLAQLDGYGVVITGFCHLLDRFRAGPGHMRRANNGVLHTITVDLP